VRLRAIMTVVALAAALIYTSVAQAQRVNSPGPIAAWLCIHKYETPRHWNETARQWKLRSWTIVNPPYEGGLQMDHSFQVTYGTDFMRRHRGLGAHAWTIREQMIAANRARVGVDWRGSTWPGVRGFHPWPTTARECGLI
jgi:hypothetical protein